ncbi:MAG: glutathione S-transferase family protein [Pseudomonadota bacterium]
MITVHGRANSSNVQKVRWALGELEVEHRLVEIGGSFGPLDTPAFLALSPYQQIPVLEDEGFRLAESNAIIRYLARDAAPTPFWPRLPAAQARAEAAMDWSQATLWAGIRPPFVAVARDGIARSDPALGPLVQALATPLTVLERLLTESGWLSGEGFGFADIPAAVAVSRLVWLVGDAALPPATRDWYSACASRPAWEAVVFVGEKEPSAV